MSLSDPAVRNAKPADTARKLFDGGGPYLEVSPSGGKRWRLKHHVGMYGRYSPLHLEEAFRERFRC